MPAWKTQSALLLWRELACFQLLQLPQHWPELEPKLGLEPGLGLAPEPGPEPALELVAQTAGKTAAAATSDTAGSAVAAAAS